MRILFSFSVLLSTVVNIGYSQTPEFLKNQYAVNKSYAIEYALANDLPIRTIFADGRIMEIQYLDESGKPVYYQTHNAEAATTTGTNRLYDGSWLGLSLSGKGVNVGVWDGGLIRATHIEFEGRAKVIEGSAISLHATHVTGTILAKGVNPTAKGMAFEATSVVYDGLNGDNAEMTAEAQNGLILSNHSYGAVLGWSFDPSNNSWEWFGDASISSQEDYRFGYYSGSSAAWDRIAYDNPYYLIVKSAGNDRNDSGNGIGAPADGPYDIIGPQGIAKNILTIGSVNSIANSYMSPSDVTIASYSSWGPTDDGRIKPDIVGMGQNLLSASSTSDNGYATLSGTSMSAPNVTGSLALLQELYMRLHNKYMSAAALKALVIHTVYEAGLNDGPDYQYGWGLLNMVDATKQLLLDGSTDNYLKEDTLRQGDQLDYPIELQANDKVVATIVWTDPAGEAETVASLDPTTIKLINDLDIRIVDENGLEHLPWIMDPTTKQASKGDNFRDNVEKVEFIAPISGSYSVIISHKGSLTNGLQNFGLVVSRGEFNEKLKPFYFIGANSNLLDPLNWSNESGAASIGQLPTSNDIVIFDNNSIGTLSSNIISLSSDFACYSFSASGSLGFNLDLNGFNLNITGSLSITNPSFQITDGSVSITPQNNSAIVKIISDNMSSSNLKILLTTQPVNLISPLVVDTLMIENGSFISNSYPITANAVSIANSSVDFRKSSLLGLNSFDIKDNFSTVIADSSKLYFNGASAVKILNGANHNFGVIDSSLDTLKISNTAFVDSLINNAKTVLVDSLRVRIAKINIGASLFVGNGKELFIEEELLIDSGPTNTLISSYANITSINPSIRSEVNPKFCFTNLDIENVDVYGNTKFVVEPKSNIINSSGWIQNNCIDVLAAGFTVEFTCSGGVTNFTDISDGNPISWEWYFGDNSEFDNKQNPVHSFIESGSYIVQLTVTNGIEQSVFFRTVEIVEADLAIPTVIQEDSQLRTTSFAPNYQWYLDYTPIQGEVEFFLNDFSASGSYSIEIWNEQCRLASDPFLITGLRNMESDIHIYPNPFYDEVQILTVGNTNLVATVRDISGRIVLSVIQKSSDKISINTANLKPGIYFVEVSNNSITFVKRVIKTEG